MKLENIEKLYFEINDSCKAIRYECRNCEYKVLCDSVNDHERPNVWNNDDFNKLEKLVNFVRDIIERYEGGAEK